MTNAGYRWTTEQFTKKCGRRKNETAAKEGNDTLQFESVSRIQQIRFPVMCVLWDCVWIVKKDTTQTSQLFRSGGDGNIMMVGLRCTSSASGPSTSKLQGSSGRAS
mmetsp:Transcript_23568/g.54831  ORF Transcript_23568/g.54831 Transcript_23568/m.54831 type:complete len:106 (+) Transcript_23568:162-479(+)